MKKEELFAPIKEKYDELKKALEGTDIEQIRKLTLEVHAMVHPAEISGRTEKTIADYVLDYMLLGNQNALYAYSREKYTLHIRKFNIEADTIYGTGRMGNENIGRRRNDYGFSLCVATSILGKIDKRGYDFNSYDKSSYDAFTTLLE